MPIRRVQAGIGKQLSRHKANRLVTGALKLLLGLSQSMPSLSLKLEPEGLHLRLVLSLSPESGSSMLCQGGLQLRLMLSLAALKGQLVL